MIFVNKIVFIFYLIAKSSLYNLNSNKKYFIDSKGLMKEKIVLNLKEIVNNL